MVLRHRGRELIAGIKDPALRRRAIKSLAKARESSTSEGLFPKLVDHASGMPLIKGIRLSNAPVVRLCLVLNLSDERSGISTEAAESG